jgi:23S rRNA (adenine2030-N6)-methyltransferase
MVVINPPWLLDESIKKITPWLLSKLTPDDPGQLNVKWVVPE